MLNTARLVPQNHFAEIDDRLVALARKEAIRQEQLDFVRRVRSQKDSHALMMDITEKVSSVDNKRAEYWADMAYQFQSTGRSRENLARNWAATDYQWRFPEIKTLLTENLKSIVVLEAIMEEHNESEGFIEVIGELEERNDSAEFDWIQFRIHFKRLNLVKALYPLMRLVKRNPKEYRARIGIAAILSKIAKTDQQRMDAKDHLTEVLKMEPDNTEAKIQLGYIYMSDAEYDKAMTLFADGLRVFPENLFITREYGRVLHEIGTVEQIETFLPIFAASAAGHNYDKPSTEIFFTSVLPKLDNGRIWMLIASLASKVKQFELAEECYLKARPLLESKNSLLSELGICINLIDQNLFHNAQNCVRALLTRTSNSEEQLDKLKNLLNVIEELSDIPSLAEEAEVERNETEMKNALKKLMDLQSKKQKTNQLVDQLDDIKTILHSELQHMANTEVSAFRSAAIKKLEKIKSILKNKH